MIINHPDGRETFYQEAGDRANQPVLLLHGLGAEHTMWAPQVGVFAEQGYYVLAPDLWGHGKSSKVRELGLGDWDAQINALLQQVGVSQCALIGVSMGGVIAQSYAVHFPEKVSRLVLADTFGEVKTLLERALAYSQLVGFRIYRLLGARMLARGMESAYKAPFAKGAQEYLSQQMLGVDFEQLILARKAINTIDAIGKIAGERIPTLVLVGEAFGKSFVAINRKIADGIKGAKFVVLAESMDPSNLVNPGAFNREVLGFLADAEH